MNLADAFQNSGPLIRGRNRQDLVTIAAIAQEVASRWVEVEALLSQNKDPSQGAAAFGIYKIDAHAQSNDPNIQWTYDATHVTGQDFGPLAGYAVYFNAFKPAAAVLPLPNDRRVVVVQFPVGDSSQIAILDLEAMDPGSCPSGVDTRRAGSVDGSGLAPGEFGANGGYTLAEALDYLLSSVGPLTAGYVGTGKIVRKSAITPTQFILTVTRDCSLIESVPTYEAEGDNLLDVRGVSGDNRHSIVRADFSALSTYYILHARLMLYCSAINTAYGNNRIQMHPVTTDIGLFDSHATWNKYDATTNWTTAGGTYDSTAAYKSIAAPPYQTGWWEGVCTATVARLASLGNANGEMLLRAVTESGTDAFVRFSDTDVNPGEFHIWAIPANT